MSSPLQTFLDNYGSYINDLWKRVYRVTFLFMLSFVAGFFSAGQIVAFFIRFFHLSNVTIVVTSPFQFLDLAVDIGLFVALVITTPIALWQGFTFIKPAISKSEYRALLSTLPLSFVLFLFGFAYGFFSLYWGLQALAKLNVSFGLQNLWDISLFLSQLTISAVLLGILFQFPIIVHSLIALGFVERSFFVQKRRHVWILTLIVVSLLPPTDGVSLVVMSVPLVLLYELTLLWSRFSTANRSLVVEEHQSAEIKTIK